MGVYATARLMADVATLEMALNANLKNPDDVDLGVSATHAVEADWEEERGGGGLCPGTCSRWDPLEPLPDVEEDDDDEVATPASGETFVVALLPGGGGMPSVAVFAAPKGVCPLASTANCTVGYAFEARMGRMGISSVEGTKPVWRVDAL